MKNLLQSESLLSEKDGKTAIYGQKTSETRFEKPNPNNFCKLLNEHLNTNNIKTTRRKKTYKIYTI